MPKTKKNTHQTHDAIFFKGKNITSIKKCNREGGDKVVLNGLLPSTAIADSQLQPHGIIIMQMVTGWIRKAAALPTTPHPRARHYFIWS